MALWQYTFIVLPNKKELIHSSNLGAFMTDDGFDDSLFWVDPPINATLFDDIANILPPMRSWSKNILLYGKQESNCFEVLVENEFAVSVDFRIDFTSDYETILRKLLESLLYKGVIIIDQDHNILPLNFEAFRSVFINSHQYHLYNKLSQP